MSSKPKKPAAKMMPPQANAAEAKRAATTAAAPARGYYDEFAALSRENFDAVLKANAAWADGVEAIASEAVGCARETLAVTGAATMELLAARTLDRVIEIQTGLAKTALEALVERTTRLSELGVALANDTWAPLSMAASKQP
ncbi:MAG: phasin family protein [Alphaproteobacteria bacterium]|nr:phasin family protein [Alphaproteobacteria bacterium]MDE1930580.1 phasin family protein [Alphaproteobacteria bacterium]